MPDPAFPHPPARAKTSGLWQVTVVETGAEVGDRIWVAQSWPLKMLGLLGRSGIEPGQGVLLKDTWNIHMFFMLFPIDCVYLSSDFKIRKIAHRVPIFTMSWSGLPPASHTLELKAGRAAQVGLAVGHQLRFDPASG